MKLNLIDCFYVRDLFRYCLLATRIYFDIQIIVDDALDLILYIEKLSISRCNPL